MFARGGGGKWGERGEKGAGGAMLSIVPVEAKEEDNIFACRSSRLVYFVARKAHSFLFRVLLSVSAQPNLRVLSSRCWQGIALFHLASRFFVSVSTARAAHGGGSLSSEILPRNALLALAGI